MMSNAEIAKPFVVATRDILQTMASMTVEAGAPYVKQSMVANGDVSALVGVTGDKKGTIAVSFSKACAVALVKALLGEDIQDLMQDVQDAVGEFTNMVSGQARASLAAKGLTLHGSTPTVVMGANHILRHTATGPVVVIPFTSGAGSFTVEFCFE